MIEQLTLLLTPTIEANGCQLYDIEYTKEGCDRILRLYVDKEGGVNLNDCEKISRSVEVILDEHDPISSSYRLQVGSPGVERKLSKEQHFLQHVGHRVLVKLFAPVISDGIGRKKFTGKIANFINNIVTLIDDDGHEWSFELKQISSCKLVVFD